MVRVREPPSLADLPTTARTTDPNPDDPGPDDPGIVVIGAGILAVAVASALVRQGTTDHLVVTDPGRIDPTMFPRPGVASTAGAALAQHLRNLEPLPHAGSLGPGPPVRVRSVKHWTELDTLRPRLGIVATVTAEPDRAITEHLTRRDVAHLVVRLDRSSARVGPLVLPGRTPCLTCIDTVLVEVDAQWPATLLRRQGEPVSGVPATLVEWGAAVCAVQAHAYLLTGSADTLGCTLELAWDEPITRVRRWRRHPDCGCAWWTD